MKTLIATVVSIATVLPALAETLSIPSPSRLPTLPAYETSCTPRETVVHFAPGQTELSETAREALAASVNATPGCEIRAISLTASAAEGMDVAFARKEAVDSALAEKRLTSARKSGETAILSADENAAQLPSGRAVSVSIEMSTARAS